MKRSKQIVNEKFMNKPKRIPSLSKWAKEAASSIIDEHSGGVKFLELLTSLVSLNGVYRKINLDSLENYFRSHQTEFGILDYGMKFSDLEYRHKMFVYRKLP